MKLIQITAIFLMGMVTAMANDLSKSIIKVSTTLQSYNASQPWEKTAPSKRRGLGAVLNGQKVLTTAEMVANSNFIELETADGLHTFPAKVNAVDYEANLALVVPTTDKGKEALSKAKPFELSSPVGLKDEVEIVQLEDNGMTIVTEGRLQGADIVSSFVDGHYFLTYEIKASLQSAANSYTIPVLHKGKLLGLLTSYSSKDQLLDVIAPEIVAAFLKDAADGDYVGFPSLGIASTATTDPNFRDWLKLSDEQGGLYITRVQPDSPASKAGIEKGDVLLAIDGNEIDRKGFYRANGYGQLYWTHLIRGVKSTGDTVTMTVLRDGKKSQHSAVLTRTPEGIIPSHTYDRAPRFLVKGGLIFQELSSSYLQAFGKDWENRAPINLLDALNHPEDYEEGRNRIVFISATIPTPATLGYEKVNSAIVTKVNGQDIADIPSLIQALSKPNEQGIHTIEIDESPNKIYLDSKTSDTVDRQLLLRGLPSLSRETE